VNGDRAFRIEALGEYVVKQNRKSKPEFGAVPFSIGLKAGSSPTRIGQRVLAMFQCEIDGQTAKLRRRDKHARPGFVGLEVEHNRVSAVLMRGASRGGFQALSGIAHANMSSSNDPATHAASPIRHHCLSKALVRALHQMAGCCLLTDLKDCISDFEEPACLFWK
jgi:hypothetical protein